MTEPDQETHEKAILDPEHPLLKRFQDALKEHYLYQINRLKGEIFEYEVSTKKIDEEREELGVQAYEVQQLVCKQQRTLEDLTKDVQTITAAKQEMQIKLNEEQANYKKVKDQLIVAEKTNMELQNELNGINLLINQVSQWETKIESNIQVNQRIAEKTRKDHMKLSEDKQKQDAQIYKVMRAIWELESGVETMNMQIKLKISEMEELEQTVATGNTNLEALQAEYRCLMHSWNSVVVAIGNRDRIVDCILNEEMKYQEKIKSTITEIDQLKKLTKKEMTENQSLTLTKSRADLDITNGKQQLDEETAKFNDYTRNINDMQLIIDQTERDVARVGEETHRKEMVLKSLQKEYEKLSKKKFQLDKTLLHLIENQATNDKAAQNLYRLMCIAKDKRKDLEIILNEAENKQSKYVSEIEAQKYINEENQRSLTEAEKMRSDLETEADHIQAENDRYQMLFRKKERHVTVLNVKLEKIMEKQKLAILVSPQEVRLTSLEKQIEETQDKIKHLQIFWLREQKNLLTVSKERQDQLQRLNLLKKQELILRQKNLKVTNELENYKKQEDRIMHNINNLQNKTVVLCDNLYKKRDKKTNLDKSNYHLQSQYDGKLKDAELECLQIEAEIAEIEDDKVACSQQLIEINREVLEWEKKIKLARQTKDDVRGSRSGNSDIANMKQEIQRMNVIYSQLKKAQEKLVKDLEHCVTRRDAIFTVAEARQSRSKAIEDKTRINFTKKMSDIKNKNKQLENEIKQSDQKLMHLKEEKTNIEDEIASNKEDIDFCENYVHTLQDQIDNRKTNLQLNFEILVMMQRQLNVYRDLIMHRSPYLHTKKDQLQAVASQEKDLNNRLCTMVQNLQQDFPNHTHELDRLYNTLKLTVFTLSVSILDVRVAE